MTPKEKAKQLMDLIEGELGYSIPTNGEPYYPETKRCALMVCENEYKSLREMLFNLKTCKVIESDSVYLHHIQNLIEEEKEVKNEIELL